MATKAELKARLTLDKSLFDRGISLAQSGASRLATGLTSVARVGARGFTMMGIAAVGLGTAITLGIKKAFDLGGSLADMSAISGRSARDILLLRRALQDAGVSMEKIDRYVLTGQDRGQVVARALRNMTAANWADVARSVGYQATILDKNAGVFDRVSDLLGRSGDKLTGFFVGAADRVSATLLPLLERFDRTDFAGFGQRFGDGLVQGARVLTGLFNNPALLFDTASNYFRASILGLGNVLIAVFKSGISFFQDGMLQALASIGMSITATMIEAFQKPIAYFHAGIEEAMGGGGGSKSAIDFQIKTKTKLRDLVGRNMGGGLNSIGRGYQQDIDILEKQKGTLPSFQDRYRRILKEGVRFGLGEGNSAGEWRAQASQTANEAITRAANIARNLQVPDVMGAGAAMAGNRGNLSAAASRGAAALDNRISPFDFISGGYLWPKGSLLPAGVMPPGYSNYSMPQTKPAGAEMPLHQELSKQTGLLEELVDEWR